jgi:hypothetical protein
MPRALTLQEKKERAEALMGQSTTPAVEAPKAVESQETPSRPERRRGAFNGTTSKLSVRNPIPGYHLHWLNDTPGRISEALSSGYEFVAPSEVGEDDDPRNTDMGAGRLRRLVGVAENGDSIYAYLLKQREEWYQEDQKIRDARVDQVDSIIKNGKNPSGGDADNFYTPQGGINIKHSTKF